MPSLWPTLVVVTVQVADAQVVHVVLPKTWLISADGVLNKIGIKAAAVALSRTKVEEMPMLCFITPTELLTSDSGKSINQTGVNAIMDMPHVIFHQTSAVPGRFINGEETPGNSGAPTVLVDVDHIKPYILKTSYFL